QRAQPGGRDAARPDAARQRRRVLRARPDGGDAQDAAGLPAWRRRQGALRLHDRPRRRQMNPVVVTGVVVLALLLAGCSYDYLQHTERVGYSAGDAVEHNLAQETTNPDAKYMYGKGGLGKNGPLADASSGQIQIAGGSYSGAAN